MIPSARRALGLAFIAFCACSPAETADRPSGAANPEPVPASAADSVLAIADTARIRGRADAPVWIVEVSDFQCPYCRIWHEETYPVVVREYVETGRARLAFLNLPLPSHRHAWAASEGAMCAGLQGKFWEMHDAIFRTQEQWSRLTSVDSTFAALASEVGVRTADWRRCVSEGTMRPLIQADYQRAVSAGVNSTPSFFIGDRHLSGAMPADSFRVAIDAAIAASRASSR